MLQTIPLDHIRHTRRNPRSDPGEDLDGLAASLGTENAPTMVQPPVVEQTGPDEYHILTGERRILAARQAGWQQVTCLVRPATDAVQAHRLRLLENLHRRALHPLDEAAGLKIAWLAANAQEMGLGEQAEAILNRDTPSVESLLVLQALLAENGFFPNTPPITWDEVLTGLGVALNPERRKKLLAVLNIAPGVQARVQELPLTEAALRSIGSLDEAEQERLVAAVAEDPNLARKTRRIARVVRDGSYTLDEALAEARGEVLMPEPDEADPFGFSTAVFPDDDDPPAAAPNSADPLGDAVVQLLDAVNQVSLAVSALAGQALAPPWDQMTAEAVRLLEDEIKRMEL